MALFGLFKKKKEEKDVPEGPGGAGNGIDRSVEDIKDAISSEIAQEEENSEKDEEAETEEEEIAALLLCRCRHRTGPTCHHGIPQPSVATHRGKHFCHTGHTARSGHNFSPTAHILSHRQHRHCATSGCTSVSLTRLHGGTLRRNGLAIILANLFLRMAHLVGRLTARSGSRGVRVMSYELRVMS